MTPNLLLVAVLLGVAFVLFHGIHLVLGRFADGRIRRKCRRNHGRVIPRDARRKLVTLSARTARAVSDSRSSSRSSLPPVFKNCSHPQCKPACVV
jgi:hypothetical protein